MLLVVIVLGLLGFTVWYITRPTPVSVTLHTVGFGPVASTVANTRVGTVKACRRAYLAPAIGGQVARLTVKEGSWVEGNQILLEIWNEDLQAELELAVSEVAETQARTKEACYVADGAKREANRLQRLQKSRLISEEDVDVAVTDAQAKRAACQATRASEKVADARVHAARSTLERTILKAPFAGMVAEVNAELGEFVTPSPPGILTLPAIDLLDISCLYISAPIDEVDAPRIHTGMSACVSLDAFPDKLCSGTVRRVAPYVLEREKQARTVEVEVEITDPNELEGLLPGYSADIEVSLDKRERVLRVPTEAILDGDRLLIYSEDDGLLQSRRIEVGLKNWEFTEVTSGLEAGEQIVLSVGREGVSPGAHAAPEDPAQERPP